MPGLICSALCSTDCFDIYSTPDLSRPVQLYQILCAAGSAYCVLTVAVLILSSVWPASVYMPLVLLTTQSLSVIHAMTQKHLCSTVQLVHQYYAASLGFVYGALTFASGLYLLSSSLRTSNWAMILLYYAELFTGVGWMYMWTAIIFSRILRKNAQQYVGGGDFSVFLLMRCACVPMESKKMLVYTPPFLLGIFFFTECSLTRYVTSAFFKYFSK